MKLHALNERITDFGFPLEMEDKDKDFHGHSRGILFAITDSNGKVLENHMPIGNNTEETLKRLIDDNHITKLHQAYFYSNNGKTEERIGYYVPYYVAEHSILLPTLNYDNIINDGDHVNYVDIELIFSHCGWNRYATIHISTVNVSILTSLYESFDNSSCDEFLESFGVKVSKSINKNKEPKYMLDFYNEIGDREEVWFMRPTDIRDKIISARIIRLKWKTKQGDINANDNST